MGRDTTADASKALRLLNSADLRNQPEHGPTGRRSTTATPQTPLNLGIVDHINRAIREVTDHAHHVNPGAGAGPDQVDDLYLWYVDATGNADAEQGRFRETLLLRHRLEHAIALGEYDVVRPFPCPNCGCWGLMWDNGGSRARCTNLDCRTPDGTSSTWTLNRLAVQQTQRTEIWRRNAT